MSSEDHCHEKDQPSPAKDGGAQLISENHVKYKKPWSAEIKTALLKKGKIFFAMLK